jgi:hypothetical protein
MFADSISLTDGTDTKSFVTVQRLPSATKRVSTHASDPVNEPLTLLISNRDAKVQGVVSKQLLAQVTKTFIDSETKLKSPGTVSITINAPTDGLFTDAYVQKMLNLAVDMIQETDYVAKSRRGES